MPLSSYNNDRDWLDAVVNTAFPDGILFSGRTVKKYLGDGQSVLSLEQFLTQHSSVNHIALTRGLASFDEIGRHEDESRSQKNYSLFIRCPEKVEMEDIIDNLRVTMASLSAFIVNGQRRRGRIRGGVSLRDLSYDAFEISIEVK